MGKKSGKNNANSNNSTTDKQEVAEEVPTTERTESQHLDQQGRAVEDLTIEELRQELAEARGEIARLKAELGKVQQRDIPLKGSKPQDVQELQDKLQRLRKEQQEADAARDKAWKQLKAVVQEISSLANPDYLQSLQVKAQD